MRAHLADVENNLADEAGFPASPEPRICSRCVFREVCPEYQSLNGQPAGAYRREAPQEQPHASAGE